jgi:threonine/homoserine/homoserine lactone efflux protein
MPDHQSLFTFALLTVGFVLTPGPNMVYLISRTLCQGVKAGFTSYAGLVVGSLFYLVSTKPLSFEKAVSISDFCCA